MTNEFPGEFQPGMEIVPGYTLIAPLGSGMAGDVWQAQAAGGVKVALKVVRNLKDLGGRKELKALKTIRDVHHPNLCPLFGFWTKDADGRVLADGETEDLTFDSISASGNFGQGPYVRDGEKKQQDSDSENLELGGTMAIGASHHHSFDQASESPHPSEPVGNQGQPAKPKVTAEQLIVVMGLGDCTLYDRLLAVRHEAGLGADAIDISCGLDPAETIRYLRASASAIDLLNQEHQIYHCDIKPQNILLVGGEAQVCDFGLAKQIDGDMRETQQAFATPAYAPPEVLHHEGYSREVDQYSLAVTYFELRTGLLPFDITTHASMLVAKSTDKLNLEALPPAERKVLQKAMRREPSQRYGSCTEFVNAIAVASGVEKSGGITIGRIMASVAVLLVLTAIGLGGWRLADPVGFNSLFFSSTVRTAERLADAMEMYQNTESESFEGVHLPLMEVVTMTSEMVEQSDGKTRSKAEQLFADASIRLLSTIHARLAELERDFGGAIIDAEEKKLTNSLYHLDPDPTESDSPVAKGMLHWASMDDPTSQDAFEEFRSLYYAAVLRFHLVKGTEAQSDAIASVREAVDNRSQDFSTIDSINLSLAAVLPVLSTTPRVGFADWTIDEWLEKDRLADLVRAETVVRESGPVGVYSHRWSMINEAFTVAVTDVVTGAAGTQRQIQETTREIVLRGFPDLLVKKQIVDLRAAVENSRWDNVDQSLAGFDSEDQLDPEQLVALRIIRILAKNRNHATPLLSAVREIKDAGLSWDQLGEARTQTLVASYLRWLGQNWDPESSTAGRLDTEIPHALELSNELDLEIPPSFLAAAALSIAKLQPTVLWDSGEEQRQRIAKWLPLLQRTPQTQCWAAALRLEQMIGQGIGSTIDLQRSLERLASSDVQPLKQVSKVYPVYLSLMGAVIDGQEPGELAAELRGDPQAVAELGSSRLEMGAKRLVGVAVSASGVDDDDYEVLRYSTRSTSRQDLERASACLGLAEFLVQQNTSELPVLDAELAIMTAAQDGRSTDDFPLSIRSQLTDSGWVDSASTQLLRAIHHVGLEQYESARDPNERGMIAEEWLIRPTAVLLQRFGKHRFGPNTGASAAKSVLIESIVVPTIDQVVFDSLRFAAEEELVPAGLRSEAKLNATSLAALCQLVTNVYTDPLTESAFDANAKPRFRRQSIAVAAVAATDRSLDPIIRQELFSQMAYNAIAMEGATGHQLIAAADRIENFGAGPETAGFLRAIGHEVLAQETDDRIEKDDQLTAAVNNLGEVLSAYAEHDDWPTLGRMQHYEALGRFADLSVQLAFLKRVDEKLNYLQPARDRAQDAIELYDPEWVGRINLPVEVTYLAKGNACEDIAHYCSTNSDDPAVVERREQSFGLAIEAFSNALDRNPEDFKIRYSLGRCQYRYAITLDGNEKDQLLREAADSLGDTPHPSLASSSDLVQAAAIAEWYIWKIKVEVERKNLNDAVDLAETAFQFVENESLPIDLRNVLSRECGIVLGFVNQWNPAAEKLMYLRGEGPVVEVIRRMGVVSDLAYRSLSTDRQLFTKMLKVINGIKKLGDLEDGDDATYAVAKIATYCVRELVVGLSAGRSFRQTNSTTVDLSRGIWAFDDQVSRDSNQIYRSLADIFMEGDKAIRGTDRLGLFRFACDLAVLMKSEKEFPVHIQQNCSVIVFYAFGYSGKGAEDLTDEERIKKLNNVQDYLTEQRFEGLVHALNEFKTIAEAELARSERLKRVAEIKRNSDLVAEVETAIKTVNELYGSKS